MLTSNNALRVLIIKTSSMGDVIHTLPALTDAQDAKSDIAFDWLVEEAFMDIPHLHPAIHRVIPVAIRRWRRTPYQQKTRSQWSQLKERLASVDYDYVIDAQGLLKSACLTRYVKGEIIGFDRHSIKEPLATLFYQTKLSVPKDLHAVERVRLLFSKALGYPMPKQFLGYGIHQAFSKDAANCQKPYVLFFHGTTWASKLWPVEHWTTLANLIIRLGYTIKLTWGNKEERSRALLLKESLVTHSCDIEIIDKLTIEQLCAYLNQAAAVISVDSGLGHLAAALHKPLIALYGPTDPGLTGCYGANCTNLHTQAAYTCLPCFKKECALEKDTNKASCCMRDLTPEHVFQKLQTYITALN